MTIVSQQYQAASFKGVPFLVNTETKEGGKKTQTHEYVNSDKRYTEEFGTLPPKFSIQAIVHESVQNRLNLERVLDEPGLGTLVHPVYGIVEVKSTTYSVTSNQRSLGEFLFSINFETSEANVTAEPAGLTNAAVTRTAEDAREALDTSLGNNYIDPELPSTLESAAEKLDEIYETVFDSVTTVTDAVQEKAADFTRIVNDGRSKVFTIVQQASNMKQSITDMYTAALKVVNTPSELFDSWSNLIDFGFIESGINAITIPRINEETNRRILNEHTRVTGLINLFEAAAYTEYKTDQELYKVKNLLDTAYNDQIERLGGLEADSLPFLALDADVREKLSLLRVQTRQVFDDLEQNIWKVVNIDTKTSSMLLTTYRYYGGLENFDFIRNLNPTVNSSNFKIPIMAITK